MGASASSWEEIEDPDPTPFERPVQPIGPRIPARHSVDPAHSNAPSSARAFRTVADLSGASPLERPPPMPSRSQGPDLDIRSLECESLSRPSESRHIGLSLSLLRDLPPRSPPVISPTFETPSKQSTLIRASLKRPPHLRAVPATSENVSRAQRPSESKLIMKLIPQFLHVFAGLSPLLIQLEASENADRHLLRILDGFAPATVFRYMSMLLSFDADFSS